MTNETHRKAFQVFPDSPAFPETHIYHWRSTEKSDDGKPYESDNVCPRWSGGLTKREYFAAFALEAMLHPSHYGAADSKDISRTLASIAVDMADALIEELNK